MFGLIVVGGFVCVGLGWLLLFGVGLVVVVFD